MTDTAMSPTEFEAALRAKGAYYHIYHPYHVAMYEGRATREQIQGWVANRFYYQVNIPLKDAAILANCPDREIRREWIQRLLDHDGAPRRRGRHRSLATPRPSGRPRPGSTALSGTGAAWRAFRRRRLRQLRPQGPLARSRQQFADRAVRAANPSITPRQLAAALPVDRPDRLRIFFARVWVRLAGMWSMVWQSLCSTTLRGKARSACWKFSSSNWTFFGACSMP